MGWFVSVVCSLFGWLSYVFRFTSAWIIVVFTIERYIGICRPLYQHVLAMGHHRRSFAVRSLCVVVALALAISVYKPFFMTTHLDHNKPVGIRPAWARVAYSAESIMHVVFLIPFEDDRSIYIPFFFFVCILQTDRHTHTHTHTHTHHTQRSRYVETCIGIS